MRNRVRNMVAGISLPWLVVWLLSAAGPLVPPLLAEVQLTEILGDPATDWDGNGEVSFRDDEWIEVTNLGPEPVDLTAYFLRDALGEEPHLNLFGVLAPGEAALFYGSHATAWQQEVGASVTGLSLNNGGDEVQLWFGDPAVPGAQLVDVYIYADHEAEDDRASGRQQPGGMWVLLDGLNPYDGSEEPGGTNCLPSPGVVNGCPPLVPADEASWGEMKADYR